MLDCFQQKEAGSWGLNVSHLAPASVFSVNTSLLPLLLGSKFFFTI